jgi:thiamine transport system permease protein
VLRRGLRILLGLFFLSPFLIWLVRIENWNITGTDWIHPFWISFVQSFLSALGSVFVGGLIALGALSLKSTKAQKFVEYWLLIPNLIPQLFLILAILNAGSILVIHVQGLWIVVLAHILLNSGLVALAFLRVLAPRVSGYLDLAMIEGASRRMIWGEVILPSLKSEILFLFLFVFSVCLTSFSIPLVLGGVEATNLEIFIYNTLRMNGDWSRAILFAAVQMCCVFAIALFVPKPIWSLSFSPSRWSHLGFRWLLPITFLPSALLFVGWGIGIWQALPLLGNTIPFMGAGVAIANSFLVGLGAGFFTLFLCLWIAYVWPQKGLSYFMKGYLAPSSAITGFAFLLLPVSGGNWPLIKIVVALTLMSFPVLFRWIGQVALEELEHQIIIARSLGASWLQILFEVIWPQRGSEFLAMAGLCALWTSTDFALTSILAEGNTTWAIYIQDLIANYRLELATLFTVPLFLIGVLCYGFFVGAARYVTR